MLTYEFFDSFCKRIPSINFTMVFADGYCLPGCNHVIENSNDDSDDYIIEQCNKTNPKHWGKVIAIKDKIETFCWSSY